MVRTGVQPISDNASRWKIKNEITEKKTFVIFLKYFGNLFQSFFSLIYYTRANIYYTDSSNFNQPKNPPLPLGKTQTSGLEIWTTPHYIGSQYYSIENLCGSKKIDWQFFKIYLLWGGLNPETLGQAADTLPFSHSITKNW